MNPLSTRTDTIDLDDYRKKKSTATIDISSEALLYEILYESLMKTFRTIQNTLAERILNLHNIPNIEGYNNHREAYLKKEATAVDWQERYIDKLDRDVTDMKSSLRATEERIASMINQTLGEMRDRDNQRIADMRDIRGFFAEERRWIIAMAVTTIIGVAAMVITVLIRR